MSRRGFLLNTSKPYLVSTNDFDVRTSAMRLYAAGLSGSDRIVIEQRVGDGNNFSWSPLYRQDIAIEFTPTKTQHIEVISGTYRVSYTGPSQVSVWYEEDDQLLDGKLIYSYHQPYKPAGGGPGAGFTLTAGDTPSIDLTYVGNTDAGTITGDIIVSPDANNQLSVHANGVYVNPSPAYSTLSTQSISMSLVGTTFSANANISPDAGNSLTIHANGLYATTGATYTVSDTSTIDLTLLANNISAVARISADVGNIISAHADGLYATGGGGGAFNMLFTDETADFVVGNSYHAYRSPDQAAADINADLPAVASNAGQIYILESRSDDYVAPGVNTVYAASPGELINGSSTQFLTLKPGMVALAYSNGVNETAVANWIQIAPTQAGGGEFAVTTFNDLRWINGRNGVGGWFSTPKISTAANNILLQNGTGLYAGRYIPLTYSDTFFPNPGTTFTLTITDEIEIVLFCDSTGAAATVNLPQISTVAQTVQVTVKNTGAGAASQTIHPFAGDNIEGAAADIVVAPGKSVILAKAPTGSSLAGWWIIGGVF